PESAAGPARKTANVESRYAGPVSCILLLDQNSLESTRDCTSAVPVPGPTRPRAGSRRPTPAAGEEIGTRRRALGADVCGSDTEGNTSGRPRARTRAPHQDRRAPLARRLPRRIATERTRALDQPQGIPPHRHNSAWAAASVG